MAALSGMNPQTSEALLGAGIGATASLGAKPSHKQA